MIRELSSYSMYEACLLHSRAERVLKAIVGNHLKKYSLTRMEWIVLSTLNNFGKPKRMSMSELSKILDINLSQTTILIGRLSRQKLVEQRTSTKDKRTKILKITAKGSALIVEVEETMRGAMREWLSDVPRQQLKTYMATLQLLSK